jgi:Putative glycolipid-binding
VHGVLRLERAGTGWRADGHARPDLEGAEEPDLSVTPFCNTFPIRRTPEGAGASLTLNTAFIDGPALFSRFSAPARSLGKKRRGCEARLPGCALLCGTARGSGAFAIGGAENRSGVCTERRVGMMPTMPPAVDRGNRSATKPDWVVWWLDYPKTSYRSIGAVGARAHRRRGTPNQLNPHNGSAMTTGATASELSCRLLLPPRLSERLLNPCHGARPAILVRPPVLGADAALRARSARGRRAARRVP